VGEVIRSGKDWSVGPKIDEFEKLLAKYVGTKYALVFNSGTSALHALVSSYGFEKGDEIIVPSFSFISTANAALFVGAKPIFAEVEEKTFGLDPKDVEKKITKKTKAIVAVHYGGCACRIEEIKKIAEKNNLILIEDAAESLGAKIGNRKVGTFGDSAMFSFCAPKVISTGEGGAIVTNNRAIYNKMKLKRSHGRLEKENYFATVMQADYIDIGYNFRISNILAALGISQLEKINKLISMRKASSMYMAKRLSGLKEISLPVTPKNHDHIFQMFTIKTNGPKLTRDGLKKYLNKSGIGAKIYFDPIHLSHFYRKEFGYKNGSLPITEQISKHVLTLPMYPSITKKEIDYVVLKIKKFYERKNK
jgi:perosamine synthetase